MTPKKSGRLANIGTNQTGQRKWDYGNVFSTMWRSDLLSQLFYTLIIIIIVGIWGRPGICKTCPRIKCLRLTLLESNFDPSEFQKSFHVVMMTKTLKKGKRVKTMIIMVWREQYILITTTRQKERTILFFLNHCC